ncbi:integrase [Dysgonomonas sp. PFB1-18]|uniref:site-specific integrase n=1 Tax=unclassified Dysgonomonas TaxID=2630389 RepID=UPI002475C2F8|nr:MULTISPECIES: site-specific integrase [unclassified Dysgonomonas]MDH6309952.1 integrase [Dysgonomonas sp. PF1-14]MDH6339862.1 integrase [Dysgonomonas sp. PF1-16]MDH6381510.1 integrase [Dysgonomonas sp. PFB1-18]MDH6398854.1 integrase [Dysgonomonas sp. PF1-23]
MARSTFKVLFYLKKNNLKPDGKAPVMGRITVNGSIAQFSCKLNIKPSLWDTKANKASGKSLEAQKINQKLDNIKTQIGKQYQHICDKDNFVSAEKVKNAYLGFGDDYRTFFSIADEFYESYAKRVGKDRTEGSYEQLLINRKRVEMFLRDRYNLSDIPIKEIEPQFIEDYYAYLLEERKLAGSTLLTAVTKLKQIMLIAQRKGYVQVNPFAGFRFKAKTRDRGYLTEDELKRFMSVELRRYKQRQIRDIFVFCAFTGLAYSDVKKLTFDDIQTSFDGELWLIAKRKKTNATFYVKLLPVAKRLIEQYRLVAKNNYIFPVPTFSDSMNRCLQRIAKLCGISKRITSHMARHSFATTVCLSKGVPIETVSQMLGHSCITTTQIYAKITNEKISKDMAALTDKIGDTYQLDTDRDESDYRNIKHIGKKQKAMFIRKKRENNPVNPANYIMRK